MCAEFGFHIALGVPGKARTQCNAGSLPSLTQSPLHRQPAQFCPEPAPYIWDLVVAFQKVLIDAKPEGDERSYSILTNHPIDLFTMKITLNEML